MLHLLQFVTRSENVNTIKGLSRFYRLFNTVLRTQVMRYSKFNFFFKFGSRLLQFALPQDSLYNQWVLLVYGKSCGAKGFKLVYSIILKTNYMFKITKYKEPDIVDLLNYKKT